MNAGRPRAGPSYATQSRMGLPISSVVSHLNRGCFAAAAGPLLRRRGSTMSLHCLRRGDLHPAPQALANHLRFQA